MLGSNMQRSAAHRAMQGGKPPLHVQPKPSQQQLIHDLMVAMPGCQVPWRHALGVITGHIAACYDQLGYHIQVATFGCVM